MRSWSQIIGIVITCTSFPVVAATTLTDETVLATLPKARIQGLSMEETMYSLQKKTGAVDPALAMSLARKNLQLGAMTDDVRRYGSALAILDSVPAQQRVSGDYQRTLADLQSVLHQFQEARSTLASLVRSEPQDDQSRRKLFYLELLRGDLVSAKEHCAAKNAFKMPADRKLCGFHASLASGQLLSAADEVSLVGDFKTQSPEHQVWAADVLLEQKFLKCIKLGSEPCDSFRAYIEPYLNITAGEKTRLAYAADRLLMANYGEDALKILPESTTNFALATRRLVIRAKYSPQTDWRDSDRQLQKTVQGSLRNESDRGAVEHAREGALVAFFVDKNPGKGKVLAESNWGSQREWIDLWLMEQAARALPDQTVSAMTKQWLVSQGVVSPFGGVK